MAMCNIPSTNDDPSYRYKMPKLITKKEGRGNGSKTCIVNMVDVARALHRPPEYTTKWFGTELGAQSTYTNKEGEGERAIVNGHHDTPIFQTMLDKFISTYVLCSNCKLPEIDMFVKKGNITAKCKACGWSGDLDNNHKIAAFITKNPPDEKGDGIVNLNEAGGKKSKDERRKEREEKRKKQAEEGEGGDDDDEDGDEKPREKKEKKEKKERSGEKKEKKEKKSKGEDGEEGEKKAKKEKKEKKEGKEGREKKEKKERKPKKEEAESDDEDKKSGNEEEDVVEYDGEVVKDVVDNLKGFIEGKDGKVRPDDFFEELRMQQLAKLFDHKIRFYIALESLFPAGTMDAKAVTAKKDVIDKVLDAVKIPASDVLWSFNAYLSKDENEKAVRSYPMVLKVIYDEEWATEEQILKYYVQDEGEDGPGFEKAKTSAAPFLKWLEEAEASGSDEDSESD